LGVCRAISTSGRRARFELQMSKRLSLIGRAGSENALDLVFSLSFD
jgi:hypothetical protein